ncbi:MULTISPECIES: endospore germination permease [unclassified Paenibacillus]|uniref:GerAB/ArcD/ProY family transporter n=1 Tax=unclassified Paenibacillus TaxID=185978 RepID=UPI001053D910|nr:MULTISPECIES: endospore germination permease [unclassified Paenibacillus]NIK68674.1 spore germination protein KB [Paenibacillus sp. BK720]TCM99041.1 spore germination protein KB [Paenibacillus sp. BK033]
MKISGYQLFWLMFTMEYGMTAIFTLSPAVFQSKQDTWISIIFASLLALAVTYIAVKLGLLYPGQTFIQSSQTILGKWLGKLILLPYFFMWFTVTGVILREFADFVFITLFTSTPLWVVILIMLLVVVYATYSGGLRSIARSSEIIGPVSAAGSVLIILFSMKDWDWLRLLPVYSNTGLLPILKGSLTPASFLAESFMVVMLVAFMKKPQQLLKCSMLGVIAASIAILSMTLTIIMVMGPNLPAKFIYPLCSVVSFISVMEFIQNLDILIVLLWIISIFTKLSLYMFITSYGTAQLFRINNWKRTIWWIAPIVFVLSLLPRNTNDTMDYAKTIWHDWIFPINLVGVPLLLLIIGSIRKKSMQKA